MAEPRWMRCAYCGIDHPWTRQFFPDPITATCVACLDEQTPRPSLVDRLTAAMTLKRRPRWVMCKRCGGCGGRFDATFIEGGCGACEGKGVVLDTDANGRPSDG